MKTLVVLYGELKTGGIENYLFGQIKYAIQMNYRVVWFHKKNAVVTEHYSEILNDIEKVECGRTRNGRWHHDTVEFNDFEKITVLAFTPFDVDAATILKEEYPAIEFTILFILANTTGRFIYPEISFLPIGKMMLKKLMKESAIEWNKRNYIRAYSTQQLKSYETAYGISIDDYGSHIVPRVEKPKPINVETLNRRINREIFNIISVSRFTFPHKNYLLGLIDDYVKLKREGYKVVLHIIGYGNDENIINEKIDKLPDSIKKDIHMYGEKSPTEIDNIMQNMHLNISTAGSVWCGARNGVVSLPARNYCDDVCEVYGYLPDSANMTTSLAKGIPAIEFIREIVLMSESDYRKKCVESYNTCYSKTIDPEYIFRQINSDGGTYKKRHKLFSLSYAISEIIVKLKVMKSKVISH